jgi:hypothetical protein
MFHRRSFFALALALVATLTLGAAPVRAQGCQSGSSIGEISLPGGGLPGVIRGELIIGQTGPTVFLLDGTLSELTPTPLGNRHGIIDGVLSDGTGTVQYLVRGRWFADGLGQGFFRCVVLELGPNGQRVGRIGGSFPPPPGPLGGSGWQGVWIICP